MSEECAIFESDEYLAFRTRNRRKIVYGLCMMALSFIYLYVVTTLWPQSGLMLTVSFILFVILLLAGFAILMYFAFVGRFLFGGIRILSRLGEPTVNWNKRFAYIVYDEVYIIINGKSSLLSFVAFRGTPQISDKKSLGIPNNYFQWSPKVEIGKIKLFRREGVFRVPSAEGDYVEGEAIVYARSLQPSEFEWTVPKFSKEELNQIIQEIKHETRFA